MSSAARATGAESQLCVGCGGEKPKSPVLYCRACLNTSDDYVRASIAALRGFAERGRKAAVIGLPEVA